MDKERKDVHSEQEEIVSDAVETSDSELDELFEQLSESDEDDGVYRLNTLSYEGGEDADKNKEKKEKTKAKKLGMVKRQQIMLIAFAVLTITFSLMYFLVFKKDYDDAIKDLNTTPQKEPLPLLDGEVYDSDGVTTLLYPQIPTKSIKNIRIENQYGIYNIEYNEESQGFFIKEHPVLALETGNLNSMTSVVTEAGYTPVNDRIVDDCQDFSIYGLVETTVDGKTKKPAKITVTAKTGESYTFYIGDLIPGQGYYYCRVEGRNAVYTVPGSASEFLVSAEDHLTPQIGPLGVSTNKIYDIDVLNIKKNGEWFVSIEGINKERNAMLASLRDIVINKSKYGVNNTLANAIEAYLQLTQRDKKTADTLVSLLEKYSSIPQINAVLSKKENLYPSTDTRFQISSYKMNYPAGYLVNDETMGNQLLTALVGLQGSYVVAAGDGVTPLFENDEIMHQYGFFDINNPMFGIYYQYTDSQGYIADGTVIFGDSGTDAYYFAYTYNYDMIVLVEKTSVPFVEWGLRSYVTEYPFQTLIYDVSRLDISGNLYYKGKEYAIKEGFTYNYTISKDEDGNETDRNLYCTATETGYSVSATQSTKNPIQALYNVALQLQILGYIAEEDFDIETKEEYARLKVTLNDKDKTETEYVFYRFGGYCYFEIDGAIGQFYVPVQNVNKLLIDAVRAARGYVVNTDVSTAELPDAYINNYQAGQNG